MSDRRLRVGSVVDAEMSAELVEAFTGAPRDVENGVAFYEWAVCYLQHDEAWRVGGGCRRVRAADIAGALLEFSWRRPVNSRVVSVTLVGGSMKGGAK